MESYRDLRRALCRQFYIVFKFDQTRAKESYGELYRAMENYIELRRANKSYGFLGEEVFDNIISLILDHTRAMEGYGVRR